MAAVKQAAKKRRRSASNGPARQPSSSEDTADRILAVATRLFAERGYEGASTKDICREAGANAAAIHYHFGSKKDLYHRIIEQFATERLEFARETLQPAASVDDFKARLEIFIRQTLETMLRQRDIVRLIQEDAERPDSSSTMYFDTLLKHAGKLREFFDHARKKGIVAADVEPFAAAGFLMSNIIHQTRNDALVKKFSGFSLSDEKYRNSWIRQTSRIFISGILAQEAGRRT